VIVTIYGWEILSKYSEGREGRKGRVKSEEKISRKEE